jgi:16S rRNA (guanine966-N2)-methyltransferase
MTDRVKTSLFSILDPRLPGATVLDLYAGTGGLGIETLSRGAMSCVFVDRDRACQDTIKKNLQRTKTADRGRIIARDARAAVKQLIGEGLTFDLIIFDPPFPLAEQSERPALEKIVCDIAEQILTLNGLLVYHHEQGTSGVFESATLEESDRRDYGRNVVTFLRKSDPESDG